MALACTLYALMLACPGMVTVVGIFIVAFMHYVATGADRPHVFIAYTGVGLSIAVCVLCGALRWQYPLGAIAVCHAPRLHSKNAGKVEVVANVVPPPWDMGNCGS